MNKKQNTIIFLLGILLTFSGVTEPVFAAAPPGVTTAPYTISYSGKLCDSSGVAITTAQDIRFSIWDHADFNVATLLPSGAIDPAAPGFSGWQETHTVTPDANGLFHLRLGTINTLPNFALISDIFLEVDVKTSGALDTSYEVIDPDGIIANTTDRFPIDSAPFAINSDTLDNADLGSGPFNVPQLDAFSRLNISMMPDGTNMEGWTIDYDDTIPAGGPGSIKLIFGNTLNRYLEYDTTAAWFNFNDRVNITGDLTVTSNINGVLINTSTVGPYDQALSIEANYPGTVFDRDGTNNKGTLESFFIDNDGTPGPDNINHYKWTTNQATLQDSDLIIRFIIPAGFKYWLATPIEFTYKTGTALAADNQLDMTIEDTTGTPVTLTGATGLASASWSTAAVTFGGIPTWTPGQEITIKVKLSAKNTGAAYAGHIKLYYNGR